MYHGYEGGIEKKCPEDCRLASRGLLSDKNDAREVHIFYTILTQIIYSVSYPTLNIPF